MVRIFFLKYHHSDDDIKYASYEICLVVILGKKMKQSKNKKHLDLKLTSSSLPNYHVIRHENTNNVKIFCLANQMNYDNIYIHICVYIYIYKICF